MAYTIYIDQSFNENDNKKQQKDNKKEKKPGDCGKISVFMKINVF